MESWFDADLYEREADRLREVARGRFHLELRKVGEQVDGSTFIIRIHPFKVAVPHEAGGGNKEMVRLSISAPYWPPVRP
jgi:hypothetical protein